MSSDAVKFWLDPPPPNRPNGKMTGKLWIASSAMLEPRVLPLKHAVLHPTYGPTNTQLCSLVSSHVIQRLSTSPFPLQQENRKPYG